MGYILEVKVPNMLPDFEIININMLNHTNKYKQAFVNETQLPQLKGEKLPKKILR